MGNKITPQWLIDRGAIPSRNNRRFEWKFKHGISYVLQYYEKPGNYGIERICIENGVYNWCHPNIKHLLYEEDFKNFWFELTGKPIV